MCYTYYLALSVKFVTGFPPKACLLNFNMHAIAFQKHANSMAKTYK